MSKPRSAPEIRPVRTAGSTHAAAGAPGTPVINEQYAASSELGRAIGRLVAPVLLEVVGPMRDAVEDLETAAIDIDDDAELGRRARVIVQELARARIDQAIVERKS